MEVIGAGEEPQQSIIFFHIYHQEYTISVSRWFVNLNATYTCQSGTGSHELSTEKNNMEQIWQDIWHSFIITLYAMA